MKRWMQALGWMSLMGVVELGFGKEVKGWEEIKVRQTQFSVRLGMMDAEREDYASMLAEVAAERLGKLEEGGSGGGEGGEAGNGEVEVARKLILLSIHLSPQNKRARWVNQQMMKGEGVKGVKAGYRKEVVSRLLSVRAKVLQQQGGLENERVGRYLNEAAVMVDGGNSKAREEVERAKAEKGVVDWGELEKDGAMSARGQNAS